MKRERQRKERQPGRIRRGLSLLSSKNLAREVQAYGYSFSYKIHVMIVLCSLGGIGAIGVLYHLQTGYFLAVLIGMLAMLPVIIIGSYQRMYQQQRFADVTTYMEQMLYSFRKTGKIAGALSETIELFGPGQMQDVLREAIDQIQGGTPAREVLDGIAERYHCAKIGIAHEMMLSIEEYGGDSGQSVDLMLADIEQWKRRTYKLQEEKKQSHADNIVSIVVATLLCAVALYVLDSMGRLFPAAQTPIDVFSVGIIQITSMLFVLWQLFVFVRSTRMLTTDWLQLEAGHGDSYIMGSYEAVRNYDPSASGRRSILFAAPFLIGAVCALVFGVFWLAIVLLALGIVMLWQHRIGQSLAKRDVREALYDALPGWLMEVALLLQHNNVQVSLAKSAADAPPVLQRELELLLQRLETAPGSLRAYTVFCEGFDVPEVTSCMKMLHAIENSGTGDVRIQIDSLIKRVNEMQDMSDAARGRHIAYKARMVFSYPIAAATGKLLVDLTVGMVLMMGMLGSITA